MSQTEVELHFGYSRSHVSETLNLLESQGKIIRKSEGRLIKRIWLRTFYPGYTTGVVRAGFLKSSEYVPFLEALVQSGKTHGYSVEMNAYDDVIELVKDLRNDVLEIALAPTFTLILSRLLSEKFVIYSPVASGGSSIFKCRESTSRSCASPESSSMMLFTREYFPTDRFPEISTFKDPLKAVRDFENGKYKYITAWEPYRTSLSDLGKHAEVGKYSDVLNDLPCCSAALNSKFLSHEKKFMNDVRKLHETIIGDLDQISENSASVVKISKVTKMEKQVITRSLKSYHFLSRFTDEMIRRYLTKIGIIIPNDRVRTFFDLEKLPE